jgi:hypothetical protein
MPRPGFYNDNEYRAYPFMFADDYATYTLPDSAIVDAGIIMGLMSGFEAAEHKVWLAQVTRSGDTFVFVFQTDAPGADTEPLVFTRELSAEDWQNEYSANENWEGFLVTGPLTALAELLAPGDTLSFPSAARILEPARIQSLVRTYLRSISVGNYSRITVKQDEECAESYAPPPAERTVVVNAENLQGPLELKEGYNCRILQTDYDRRLQVGAQRGAGKPPDGELCANGSQLPLYVGEPLADDSKFFSGGPACDEVILTINGVGGSNVNIITGAGLKLTTYPQMHTITVEVNDNNLAGNC